MFRSTQYVINVSFIQAGEYVICGILIFLVNISGFETKLNLVSEYFYSENSWFAASENLAITLITVLAPLCYLLLYGWRIQIKTKLHVGRVYFAQPCLEVATFQLDMAPGQNPPNLFILLGEIFDWRHLELFLPNFVICKKKRLSQSKQEVRVIL